jgi:transcriptional regulator with XRE-family HTH domain
VSDLSELQKFLSVAYRESYLDSHVKSSISYQLQALRQKSGGINQTKFGQMIGQPQSVVSRLEGGEYGGVNINTLLKIANRLGIGLQVRFCSFEDILAEDVSPAAMAVECISETIARLTKPQVAPQFVVVSWGEGTQTSLPGSPTWQTKPTSSHPLSTAFPGSGTSSLGISTATQPSSPWVPMM